MIRGSKGFTNNVDGRLHTTLKLDLNVCCFRYFSMFFVYKLKITLLVCYVKVSLDIKTVVKEFEIIKIHDFPYGPLSRNCQLIITGY